MLQENGYKSVSNHFRLEIRRLLTITKVQLQLQVKGQKDNQFLQHNNWVSTSTLEVLFNVIFKKYSIFFIIVIYFIGFEYTFF